MEDMDQKLRRVVFELPNEHVPELMAALGDFALEHNISIAFEEADPEHTEASLVTDRYNPELVTQITDKESGVDVAAIALENLQKFAIERDGHPMAGTRFYNAVKRGPAWVSNKLDEGEYESVVVHDADDVLMLRADKARQLLVALQTGTMMFDGLRHRTIGFFSDFYGQLILSGSPSD